MRRIGTWLLAAVCLVVGLAGLILPGLQGTPFLFLALTLIAPRYATRLKGRLFRRFLKSDWVYLEEWKKASGVRAGFTTRRFPLKISKTAELAQGDAFERFTAAFALSKVTVSHKIKPITHAVLLDQVHGAEVAILEDVSAFTAPGLHRAGSFDAAVTNIPDLTLLVFSADCLSIFFHAGDWVGVAHAGWRGTRGGIAVKTLRILCEKAKVLPSEVRIIFGPCISAGSYEVGEEFLDYFETARGKHHAAPLRRIQGKLHFDLVAENERQLLNAGVMHTHLSDHGICTFKEKDSFYSYRREGEKAGRMISMISRSTCSGRS